jgi:hypothetical protein
MRAPLVDRLLARREITEAGCWQWTGATNRGGYGVIGAGSRDLGTVLTHRASYELFVGQIPDGLHLDHLCNNRVCFNPAHLEAVTQRENNLRAVPVRKANYQRPTKCKRGHEYTPENTIPRPTGWLLCRTCRDDRAREYRRARQENAA